MKLIYSKSWNTIKVKIDGDISTADTFEDVSNRRLVTLTRTYKVKKGKFKNKKVKEKIKFKYAANGKPKWYRHESLTGQGMTKEECQGIIDRAWGKSLSFEVELWETYSSSKKISSYWKKLDHYAGILSRSDIPLPVVSTVETADTNEQVDVPVIVVDKAVEIPVVVENVDDGVEVVTKVVGIKSDEITQTNYTDTFNSTGGSTREDPLIATQVVTNGTVEPVEIELSKVISTKRRVVIESSFTVDEIEYTSTPVKLPISRNTTYESTITSTSEAGNLSLKTSDFENTYNTSQLQELYSGITRSYRTASGPTGAYNYLLDVSPVDGTDTFRVNGTIQQANLPNGVPLDCGWGKSRAISSNGLIVAVGAPGGTYATNPYIGMITNGTVNARGLPSGRIFVYNHQPWKDANKSNSLIGSPLKSTMTGWGSDRFGQAICMNDTGTKLMTISRDFNLANLRSDEGMGRNVGSIHEFNLVDDEWVAEDTSPLGSIEDNGYPGQVPYTQVEMRLIDDNKLLIYTFPELAPGGNHRGEDKLRMFVKTQGTWTLSAVYDIDALVSDITSQYQDETLLPNIMPTSTKLVGDKLVAVWETRYDQTTYVAVDSSKSFQGKPHNSTGPLSDDSKVLHLSQSNQYGTQGVYVRQAGYWAKDVRPTYTPDAVSPATAIISFENGTFTTEYIAPVCPKPDNTNTFIPVVYDQGSNGFNRCEWMDVGVTPDDVNHPFHEDFDGNLEDIFPSWLSWLPTNSKKGSHNNPFHNAYMYSPVMARRHVEVAIDPSGDHVAFVFGGGSKYSHNTWGSLGGNAYPGGWVMSVKKQRSSGDWKAASGMDAINKIGSLYTPASNYTGPVHDAVQLVPYHLGFGSNPSRGSGDMQNEDIAFHDTKSTRDIMLKNDRLFVPTVSYPYAGGKTSVGQWTSGFNQSGYRTIPNLLKIDLVADGNNKIGWKQTAMITLQDDKVEQSLQRFHLSLGDDGDLIAFFPNAYTGMDLLKNIEIPSREIIEETGLPSVGDRYIKSDTVATVGAIISASQWNNFQDTYAAKFTDNPQYNVDRLPSIGNLRFSGQIVKLSV